MIRKAAFFLMKKINIVVQKIKLKRVLILIFKKMKYSLIELIINEVMEHNLLINNISLINH